MEVDFHLISLCPFSLNEKKLVLKILTVYHSLLYPTADPRSRTFREQQGVIHYAAKYNAVASLKVLVEHRVDYNIKDYRQRTPLFVAAEMGTFY